MKYPIAAQVVGWLGAAFVTVAGALVGLAAASWAYGAAESGVSVLLRARLRLSKSAWLAAVVGRGATLAHAGAIGAWTLATKVAAAGQWLLNAALLANPIGLVVAGVALLVGGAVLLWRTWKPVMDWFLGAWEGLKGFVGSAAEKLGLVATERNSGAGARRGRRGRVPAAGDAAPGAGAVARRVAPVAVAATLAAAVPAGVPADLAPASPVPVEFAGVPADLAPAPPALADLFSGAAPSPVERQVTIHVGERPVIEIHAAPGSDPAAIAREVERHYAQMMRRAAAAADLAEDDA